MTKLRQENSEASSWEGATPGLQGPGVGGFVNSGTERAPRGLPRWTPRPWYFGLRSLASFSRIYLSGTALHSVGAGALGWAAHNSAS